MISSMATHYIRNQTENVLQPKKIKKKLNNLYLNLLLIRNNNSEIRIKLAEQVQSSMQTSWAILVAFIPSVVIAYFLLNWG